MEVCKGHLPGTADVPADRRINAVKIESMVLGAVATNCYFVINEETKEAIVIDPADRADRILKKAAEEGLTLAAVLLTHGHGDHIMAVPELREKTGIPVYACKAEEELLADPNQNLSAMLFGKPLSLKADVWTCDEQELTVAGMKFRVLFTPGHTPGGCCYYSREAGVLFSGDTLFCGSVGRTDFPGGSMGTLTRSIREKLMPLPDETAVYAGHQDETTVGAERRYNPFLGDF